MYLLYEYAHVFLFTHTKKGSFMIFFTHDRHNKTSGECAESTVMSKIQATRLHMLNLKCERVVGGKTSTIQKNRWQGNDLLDITAPKSEQC